MNKIFSVLSALVVCSVAITMASATTVELNDWAFNVNGTAYPLGSALPGSIDVSGFDTTTGLGTVHISLTAPSDGTYNIEALFDHDLHVPFYNEYGSVSGTAAAGQMWTVGIYTLPFTGNEALDNANNVPGTTDNFFSDCTAGASCNNDVFLGMGFTALLSAGDTQTVTFTVSTSVPNGFYLGQHNPDASSAGDTSDIYLSGTASTSGTGGQTPEPASWLLMSGALAVMAPIVRRRRRV